MFRSSLLPTQTEILESQVSFDLSPKGGFPAVDFKMFRIEDGNRHRCGRLYCFVFLVVRTKFKFRAILVTWISESINRQTEVGEHVIVNNVFEEDGIRIERFLGQNDAVGECLVVTDGTVLRESSSHCKGLGSDTL